MDVGAHSLENLQVCHSKKDSTTVSLRKTPKETWLRIAENKGTACEQREIKFEYIGAIEFQQKIFDRPLRYVFHVIHQDY